MKVLIKWLKDFVEIKDSPNELAEKLTMVGLEVEEITETKDIFKGLIVAKVLETSLHPTSNKLKVCKVFTGKETLQIVCGAPNVMADQNVVLALPGALVQGNKIEKVTIKGVESYGMLCSEKELGLAISSDGIIILPNDLTIGKNILEEAYKDLDDVILNINITPNRGDCLSHLGIAREISAFYGKPLNMKLKTPKLIQKSKDFNIKIENIELCPRYTAKLIRDIKIMPSPDFIKARLSLCGMRPINNIVDITNYIMLSLGQPLHAFDYDLIQGKTIIVRNARDGEFLKTLDGKDRILKETDLVIADMSGPIALAGVMGGENSEVMSSTKNILLESAYFAPTNIRKTARSLGLSSEASYRFERGVDIQGAPLACEMAAQMMADFAEGKICAGVYDAYPSPKEQKIIKFRLDRCDNYLGFSCDPKTAEERLLALNFGVVKKRYEWDIIVPSFRSDVIIEEDIYEEIARLGFYNEISATLPTIPMRSRDDLEETRFFNEVQNLLIDRGAYEIITYSFIKEKDLLKLKFPMQENFVYIKNPLAEEKTLMRPTLLPSHLDVAINNHIRMNYDFIFYEMGKKYFVNGKNNYAFNEVPVLSLIFSGFYTSKSWYSDNVNVDFYIVKGFIEKLFDKICRMRFNVKPVDQNEYPFLHPVDSAEIIIEDKLIGYFGRIHPHVETNWELKRDIYVAELDIETLKKLYFNKKNQYYNFSRYPWVDRDITVIVDDNISYEQILKIMLNNSSNLLKDITLVDIYKGDKIGKNKKSLTFKLVYQAMDRTLSDEEVNEANSNIAKSLQKNLSVEFPK